MSRIQITPTSARWVAAAIADLPTLLVDHAHCEKKAASTAVRLLFEYPDWAALQPAMSRLAREELVHFDQVRRELARRGIAYRRLHSAGYAAKLFALVRADDPRTKAVDQMIVGALIEARSHERFVALASTVPDDTLRSFYAGLAEAEARHGELYLELADEVAGATVVDRRLAELAAAEADIIARPHQPLRMHSGG